MNEKIGGGSVAAAHDNTQYPAVNVAYDFVLPSYELLTTRLEAADTRLTTLLTIASSFALGVPLFAQAVRPHIPFRSLLFFAAMGFILVAAALGVIGLLSGRIKISDPTILYQKFLHKSEWAFKKDMIYFAGEHFHINAQTLEKKWKFTIWMTFMMLFSVFAFVLWISR